MPNLTDSRQSLSDRLLAASEKNMAVAARALEQQTEAQQLLEAEAQAAQKLTSDLTLLIPKMGARAGWMKFYHTEKYIGKNILRKPVEKEKRVKAHTECYLVASRVISGQKAVGIGDTIHYLCRGEEIFIGQEGQLLYRKINLNTHSIHEGKKLPQVISPMDWVVLPDAHTHTHSDYMYDIDYLLDLSATDASQWPIEAANVLQALIQAGEHMTRIIESRDQDLEKRRRNLASIK